MGKLQIVNLIVSSLLVLLFGGFCILQIVGSLVKYHRSISLIPFFLIPLIFLSYYFITYIKFFKSSTLENNWIYASYLINIFPIIFLFSGHLAAGNFFEQGEEGFVVLAVIVRSLLLSCALFFVSIILFLIGYRKSKKGNNKSKIIDKKI